MTGPSAGASSPGRCSWAGVCRLPLGRAARRQPRRRDRPGAGVRHGRASDGPAHPRAAAGPGARRVRWLTWAAARASRSRSGRQARLRPGHRLRPASPHGDRGHPRGARANAIGSSGSSALTCAKRPAPGAHRTANLVRPLLLRLASSTSGAGAHDLSGAARGGGGRGGAALAPMDEEWRLGAAGWSALLLVSWTAAVSAHRFSGSGIGPSRSAVGGAHPVAHLGSTSRPELLSNRAEARSHSAAPVGQYSRGRTRTALRTSCSSEASSPSAIACPSRLPITGRLLWACQDRAARGVRRAVHWQSSRLRAPPPTTWTSRGDSPVTVARSSIVYLNLSARLSRMQRRRRGRLLRHGLTRVGFELADAVGHRAGSEQCRIVGIDEGLEGGSSSASPTNSSYQILPRSPGTPALVHEARGRSHCGGAARSPVDPALVRKVGGECAVVDQGARRARRRRATSHPR